MPHVVVKLYPGRSEAEKQALAEAVTAALTSSLNCGADLVSVGIEEVQPADWKPTVYEPEIMAKPETIYKKPGY